MEKSTSTEDPTRDVHGDAAKALRRLILDPHANPSQICNYLDSLPDGERARASRSLGMEHQRRLWNLVDRFAELSLEDMVPGTQKALSPVPHFGRNTLPVHSHFEKRFYRYTNGSGESAVGGSNFQSLAWLTGPGYYVATEDAGRRELLIDYRRLPSKRPKAWPAIVSNERGVSRFVYGFMVDTCRRVSEHVTIGRANRHGKDMPAWFTLCRSVKP